MRNWSSRRVAASWVMVALLCAIAFPSQLAARVPEINITGKLLAFDGISPAEGAVVSFRDVKTGKVFKSKPADKNGKYEINNVPDGEYAISAETSNGLVNLPNSVVIRGGQPAAITIILPEAAAVPLAEGRSASTVGKSKKWLAYPIVGGIILTAIVIGANNNRTDPESSPSKP